MDKLTCPVDHQPLIFKRFEGDVNVWTCPACEGIWLNREQLEAIEETIEHKHDKLLQVPQEQLADLYEMARQKQRPPVNCPGCNIEMERKEYGYCSAVMIDICSYCGGIWMDKGEMEALEVFYEHARISTRDRKPWLIKGLRDVILGL